MAATATVDPIVSLRQDFYKRCSIDSISPGMFPITPNDDDQLSYTQDSDEVVLIARQLYITTGGTIKVQFVNGQELTFTVGDDVLFPPQPCGIVKVFATGTTATDIYGFE